MSVRQPRLWIFAFCLFVALAVAAIGLYERRLPTPTDVPFSDLLRQVDAGTVSRLSVSGDVLTFTTTGGKLFESAAPPNYITGNPAFVAELVRKNVSVDVRPAQDPLGTGVFLVALALLGFTGFAVYRISQGRVLWLGDSMPQADHTQTTVTFDDVAGVDEAKEEVKEIVDFLRSPQRFTAIGGRIPKGVLLVGPPGTGKTLLAQSIAGEAQVPFLFASGSDFVEMYAGVGARRIRKLFKDARRHPSCIIFIDELDAVGRSRGNHSLSNEEREQTLNQLLVEMDGFAATQGVVVIAATNRPDILDAALLRPGRFDRQVTVGAPDLKGREQILGIHTRRIALDGAVNLRQIARGTPGFSGAELANLVNEAALLAVRGGHTVVGALEFDSARDKILMGAERKSLAMSEQERTTCAYHESGHAVVAALLPHADPLHKVTIVPRGRALGVTMQLPAADRHTHTREFLETQLAILMGGRIAEELFLDQLTSGAQNDIQRATELARRMVCEFGMSDVLGPLAYPAASPDGAMRAVVSEATAQVVDSEVRALVMRARQTARTIIDGNRAVVRAMADELLAVESLDAEEIKAVIARVARAA